MTPTTLTLVAFAGTAAAASGFDVSGFLGTLTLQDVGQTLGLGALAFLFARDLILTRGQHDRRVADLVRHYDALAAERDLRDAERELRYSEMKTSRDYYREARNTEADRANRVTQQLAELAAETTRSVSETMGALETAAREVAGDA